MSKPHTMVNAWSPQIMAGTEVNKLPMAVATNQPPIIIPFILGGATLETKLIPIGERNNSAKVNTK